MEGSRRRRRLSIAFWGPDGRIIDVLEMTPCGSGPCPVYTPGGGECIGAVEAGKGFFADNGVAVGDTVGLAR